jgi:16S rRNA (cytosine1402-N4)-methyltransferase
MSNGPIDFHHVPVMASEVCRYLVTDHDGGYLDATAGLGGHLRALAEVTSNRARLYGIDIDGETVAQARESVRAFPQIKQIEEGSYRDVDAVVDKLAERAFDGILLDLGISSKQLDDPERGFSFQQDGPLDMRFSREGSTTTAADLVNTANVTRLTEIFRHYGEERKAARIAEEVIRERKKQMIQTTRTLREIVMRVVPPPHQNKSLARVFQALRIAVNDELNRIQNALPRLVAHLKLNGRLAVIAYHSLEDRLVKRYFQYESQSVLRDPDNPLPDKAIDPLLKVITRKPVYPTDEEMATNSRARSARLRVAERVRG